MSSHEAKSNNKRQHAVKNDDPNVLSESVAKCQRPNSPSHAQPTKITDLFDECLENVFNRLDLISLFNVTGSNEWLRPAARLAYKRNYGQRLVCLTAIEKRICATGAGAAACQSALVEDAGTVVVFGLKACLEFLRCLGPSIANLAIVYKEANAKWCHYVHQYINQYCAENLATMVFLEKSSNPIEHLEKPFVNVQSVLVVKSDIGNQFASFPQWFPNLCILEMRDVCMYDPSIAMPFDRLVHLGIDINNGTIRNGFTKREAANLLRLCRGLLSLEVRMPAGRQGMTLNTLLNCIDANQNLQKLIISMERYWSIVKLAEVQRFASEHPNVFTVCLKNYKFTADTAGAMVRQLNDLKQFHFQIKNSSEYLEFVSQLNAGQWMSVLRIDSNDQHLVELRHIES